MSQYGSLSPSQRLQLQDALRLLDKPGRKAYIARGRAIWRAIDKAIAKGTCRVRRDVIETLMVEEVE